MMYDDIANDSENPVKGNIINKPNGPNVYTNVPKDYTGETVTAANFLAVISGKADQVKGGNGRVLNTGPNDNIFIFFSDHGGPGLIAMPSGPYLYAKDLVATLQQMATAKKFHQLVFYLEACESGSMFDGLLPNNINIFATTASNPDESSYACYWDDTRQAYLGDLYSVSWMENSDAADFTKETLQQQFKAVQNLTSTSHVCEYGQQALSTELIADFQAFDKFMPRRNHVLPTAPAEHAARDAVDSRDVVAATLTRRLELALRQGDHKRAAHIEHALHKEMKHREAADRVFASLAEKFAGKQRAHALLTGSSPVHHDCVPAMIAEYEAQCGRFSDYSLKFAKVLNNMCHAGVSPADIRAALPSMC